FLTWKEFMEYSKRMILEDYLGMSGVHYRKPISENFYGSFKKLEFDAACRRTILIPFHVLPYLKNLQELKVHSSDVVQVIFDTDEIEVETRGIIFGLKKLILYDLPNLKCVWKENIEGIVSFSNLKRVDVDGCESLLTLFPLSLAKDLGNLEILDIKECEKMVEIVGMEDEMEHGTTIIFEFPCLSYLYLENMPLLSCFCPRKHHLECPLLDKLYVECCPKLKLFKSSFDDDSKREVLEAPTNLLQQPLFSIEKVSPKLEGLTLNEENIKLMSDARLPQYLLCKLKILKLSFEDDNNEKDNLPFDFFHKLPNLERLTVQKCFGLKEMFPSQKLQVHNKVLAGLKRLYLWELRVINLAMFSGIQTSKDSDFTFHVDLNTTVESLFHEKDFFNYSMLMILHDYLGMIRVQHAKPTASDNFFGSFRKLEFDITCNRSFVIPSHILPYLKNLEELMVHSSDVVQVIFDTDEIAVETKGIIFGLKKLILYDLPNLKCVWKENIEGIVSFSNLQRVDVEGCGSLVTLFPSSLAKSLGKLNTLDIQECEKMVEIVGKEDEMEDETTIMFEFHCLSYLNLETMPLLSCFYPGKHHLECPLLDQLYVECCPKLKLFISSFGDDSKKEVLEAPTNLLQQPLFSIEKVSPKLKGLTLNEENIKLMSDARLPQDLLCKVKILILSFEDDNNEKGDVSLSKASSSQQSTCWIETIIFVGIKFFSLFMVDYAFTLSVANLFHFHYGQLVLCSLSSRVDLCILGGKLVLFFG
ncbi:hypothetical protein V8G54_019891, partial [Vigna mungo]